MDFSSGRQPARPNRWGGRAAAAATNMIPKMSRLRTPKIRAKSSSADEPWDK
jgi:hypothetical protein